MGPPAYAYSSGMVIKMGIATQNASTGCHTVPQLNWRCLEEWLTYQILQVNTDQASQTRGTEAGEAKAPVSISGALNSVREFHSSS